MSTSNHLDAELLELIPQLTLSQKRLVRGIVEKLLASERPRGTPPSALAHLRGTLSREAAEEMKAIIEEDCERINPESW